MRTANPLLDMLAWQLAMGVDVAVCDDPVDRFAEARTAERPAPPAPRPAVPAAPERRTMPPAGALLTRAPDDVALAAREAAAAAATLDELRRALAAFEGCALKATATQLVFADGAEDARLMFVGEAPGRDEDIQGKPFVGRSGQLLDRMLAAIGLDRTKVYIANVVPWRPPGNRTPTAQEIAACKPFIERQIALVNPDMLVCLGAPAAQTLLGIADGILKSRGRLMRYDLGSRGIAAMATLHPAYLLRAPLQKRLAWRDFQTIRDTFTAAPATG